MNTWNEHAKNGEAFAAEDFVVAAGGLYPHVQLFNPVGSGKRVRLRSSHMSQAGLAYIRRHDTPLAVLGPPAGLGFVLENLLGGGPAAVAEVRHENLVAITGSGFWAIYTAVGETGIYPAEGMGWGHDLLEGQGMLWQGTLAMTFIVNWQWVELPL